MVLFWWEKGLVEVFLVVTTLLGVQCLGAVCLLNTSLCLACLRFRACHNTGSTHEFGHLLSVAHDPDVLRLTAV